jgi:hypothetical protein
MGFGAFFAIITLSYADAVPVNGHAIVRKAIRFSYVFPVSKQKLWNSITVLRLFP